MAVFMCGRPEAPPLYKGAFADNSWDKIARACQANEVPDTWLVGDSKSMTINGTSYEVVIIGKNHDTYSDGTGVAPLTFQLKNCYATNYAMHSSDDNSFGWTNCAMRKTSLPAILALFPDEVKNNIRQVNKLASKGYQQSAIDTSADFLFLLSEIEVLGSAVMSRPGEGRRYEYFTVQGRAAKTNSYGSISWWVRSPRGESSTQYCCINTTGGYDYSAAGTARGVSPAFCF